MFIGKRAKAFIPFVLLEVSLETSVFETIRHQNKVDSLKRRHITKTRTVLVHRALESSILAYLGRL